MCFVHFFRTKRTKKNTVQFKRIHIILLKQTNPKANTFNWLLYSFRFIPKPHTNPRTHCAIVDDVISHGISSCEVNVCSLLSMSKECNMYLDFILFFFFYICGMCASCNKQIHDIVAS